MHIQEDDYEYYSRELLPNGELVTTQEASRRILTACAGIAVFLIGLLCFFL